MFGNDAEDGFKSLLDNVSAAERAEIVRAISVIAEHFGKAAASVEEMIAECSNLELAAQSWDTAQRVIQAAKKAP